MFKWLKINGWMEKLKLINHYRFLTENNMVKSYSLIKQKYIHFSRIQHLFDYYV